MTDQQAIRYLLDRAAIEDVLCTYSRAIDRRRHELLSDVYAADVHFRNPHAEYHTREGVREAIKGMTAYKALMHMMGNQLAQIRDDVAETETYAICWHFHDDAQGQQQEYVIGARYCDRIVFDNGRWVITDRVRNSDWVVGKSLLVGKKA
jgi:hypothetical protein